MVTQLDSLQKQADYLKSGLSESQTAYENKAPVVKGDLTMANRLTAVNKQIAALKDTQLSNQWYGSKTTTAPAEDSGTKDGLLMGGLKFLQKPLNMMAGTAQYAMGDGADSDYFKNLDKAMASGLTFGNILEKKGAPKLISMPLGFALDVFLDPVNWIGAGEAALIPRIFGGAVKGAVEKGTVKGAVEAAKTGLVSGLEKKAVQAMGSVPFVRKASDIAKALAEKAVKEGLESPKISSFAKGAVKYTNLMDKIGDKAILAEDAYRAATGTKALHGLGKTGWFGMPAGIIGKKIEEGIRKIPSIGVGKFATPTGDAIADAFEYSITKSMAASKARDLVETKYKELGFKPKMSGEIHFKTLADAMNPNAQVAMPVQLKKAADAAETAADAVIQKEMVNVWKDGKMAARVKGLVSVENSLDNATALNDLANLHADVKLLEKSYNFVKKGRTGVAMYDAILDKAESTTIRDWLPESWAGRKGAELNQIATDADKVKATETLIQRWNTFEKAKQNILDTRPLESLLVAHRKFTEIFKTAKVPMNPSSHVVANLGNTVMAWMMGLPVQSPEFIEAMYKANQVAKGRLGVKGLRDIFDNEMNSMLKEGGIMDKNPTLFRKALGVNAQDIIDDIQEAERIYGGRRPALEAMKNQMGENWDNLDEAYKQGKLAAVKDTSAVDKIAYEKDTRHFDLDTPSQTLGKSKTTEGGYLASDVSSGWGVNEVDANSGLMQVARDKSVAWAADKPHNVIARLANSLMNTMPQRYEQIDQTWKMATVSYLTRTGLTEEQLTMISRYIGPLDKGIDILPAITKNGQRYYRLTPEKSIEVALEAFMDYSAMPDAIRVLRALPFVGAPFYSFPFAMAIKTGKTVINNPALFNKVAFMMNEITGLRSPEEKAALEDKYNAYLNSSSLVRVYGNMYTDIKNWIPYMSLNMFSPSERKYGDTWQEKVLQLSDKFPVLQDPFGQLVKDFIIQPALLAGTGAIPQGQFGQALFPSYDIKGKKIDASAVTKALYAGRTIAEAVTPGALGFSGLVAGGMSPEMINLLPSYLARKLGMAETGKSVIGKQTKESPSTKTLRTLSGGLGVPLYPLNTDKTFNN